MKRPCLRRWVVLFIGVIEDMEYEIDFSQLRMDLIDYYGTALMSGSSMAIINLSIIENATNRELIELAQKNCLDMGKYII